jgi:hypothetical protein
VPECAAWHTATVAGCGTAQLPGLENGMRAAISTDMASTGTKSGFALAWILGIPLPILLVIYLISRC